MRNKTARIIIISQLQTPLLRILSGHSSISIHLNIRGDQAPPENDNTNIIDI